MASARATPTSRAFSLGCGQPACPERHFSSDPLVSAKRPLALLRSVSIDEKTDEVAWIASAEHGMIL